MLISKVLKTSSTDINKMEQQNDLWHEYQKDLHWAQYCRNISYLISIICMNQTIQLDYLWHMNIVVDDIVWAPPTGGYRTLKHDDL